MSSVYKDMATQFKTSSWYLRCGCTFAYCLSKHNSSVLATFLAIVLGILFEPAHIWCAGLPRSRQADARVKLDAKNWILLLTSAMDTHAGRYGFASFDIRNSSVLLLTSTTCNKVTPSQPQTGIGTIVDASRSVNHARRPACLTMVGLR